MYNILYSISPYYVVRTVVYYILHTTYYILLRKNTKKEPKTTYPKSELYLILVRQPTAVLCPFVIIIK
jgi:hypothetical protein